MEFSPCFGLPFEYSAANLQEEFMDMDNVNATLISLQEEARLLMKKLEESKLQCDELKLYLEYGSSAAKGANVGKKESSELNKDLEPPKGSLGMYLLFVIVFVHFVLL